MSTSFGVWLAALSTLGLYSLLYKENPFYRLVEHIYVGISVAHLAVVGYFNINEMAIRPMFGGKWILLIPVVSGFLLFTRWFKPVAYLSRIPLGYIMGVTSAVVITGALQSNFLDQIKATMMPLNTLNNVLFFISVVTTTMYFFFTVQPGPTGKVINYGSRIGQWVMMVAFGAAFGYTVMSRISLFTGRLQFLFTDWIHLIK